MIFTCLLSDCSFCLSLQRQKSLRWAEFLDIKKCQRCCHLEYCSWLLLHSSLTYTKVRKESGKMTLICWFIQSFSKVEWSVKLYYCKEDMEYMENMEYTWPGHLSPFSGISPSLIDTRIWCIYYIWKVFFPARTVPLLQQKKAWTSSDWPECTNAFFFVPLLSLEVYSVHWLFIWWLMIILNFSLIHIGFGPQE